MKYGIFIVDLETRTMMHSHELPDRYDTHEAAVSRLSQMKREPNRCRYAILPLSVEDDRPTKSEMKSFSALKEAIDEDSACGRMLRKLWFFTK